ncbi:MAG: hypothetical protein JNL59_11815 [Chitinophagaceae bacterium]|nr:hypothetical protein [Chitinophagaceae bacterium]
MKKLLLLLVLGALSLSTYAITEPAKTVPGKKALKATEVYLPIGKNKELVSVYELSRMSPRELQKLTGKKMGFFDKIGFKISQKKLRSSINPDGTFNSKRVNKYFKKMESGETGFHIGGFALGILLGLIGVLIAYLINDDKKRNRVKWAWIGWGVWVLILILALI